MAEARPQRSYRSVVRQTVEFAIPLDAVSGDLKNVEYLGTGSFGNVIKVPKYVYKNKEYVVAIKKLYDPLRDQEAAMKAYREISLLQLMKHENVVKLIDIYTPNTSAETLRSVYLVTEYAGMSIAKVLYRQLETGDVQLTPDHCQFIIYQLLRALKYIHSANVIHRDLKPGNLAVTDQCDLTVLDFGQSRTMNLDGALTHYVMTRWYRSPEVMLWKIGEYNLQADMWSVGCILAEVTTGYPLFQGEDAFGQYELITELCGSPDQILLDKIRSNETVYDIIKRHEFCRRRNFAEYFPKHFSPELIDFLDKTLVLDPDRRMTVEEGLAHPYLSKYSVPGDEPSAESHFTIEGECDKSKTLSEWREIIWKDIQKFIPLQETVTEKTKE